MNLDKKRAVIAILHLIMQNEQSYDDAQNMTPTQMAAHFNLTKPQARLLWKLLMTVGE